MSNKIQQFRNARSSSRRPRRARKHFPLERCPLFRFGSGCCGKQGEGSGSFRQNAPANGIFSGKRLKVLSKKKTTGRVRIPFDRQKKRGLAGMSKRGISISRHLRRNGFLEGYCFVSDGNIFLICRVFFWVDTVLVCAVMLL